MIKWIKYIGYVLKAYWNYYINPKKPMDKKHYETTKAMVTVGHNMACAARSFGFSADEATKAMKQMSGIVNETMENEK
jgi:hypothetical protein